MANPLIATIVVLFVAVGLTGCNPRMTGAILKGTGDGIVEQNRQKQELRRAYIHACAKYGKHCDKI